MQAVAFLAVLAVIAGNILFFAFPILFAVIGAIVEETVNLYRWASDVIARFIHGRAHSLG